MKTKRLLIYTTFCLFSLPCILAQDGLKNEIGRVTNEFQKWDPIRGEWLSKSIFAIAHNEAIPDRTFPENFTPSEMLSMVPLQYKENIRTMVSDNKTNSRNNPSDEQMWVFVADFLNRPTCRPVSGRTFGDPHFTSFDGNNYSLQSVGEFILAKSKAGFVEVQTRQRASGDDFSLNTAVAMNVGGDRLCVYADDKPDSDISTPLRLNGKPIHVNEMTYFLPHGGTIRQAGKDYTITWATGETVKIQMINSGKFGFMNVTTAIYPCIAGGYEGLLGNANGTPNDDLRTPINGNNHGELFESMTRFGGIFASNTGNQDAEKVYQDRLTKEFGNYFRVTETNSLFDYGVGRNTASYTDLSFPRMYKSINDLNTAQRTSAQRNCEKMGVTGNELRGCIYDNAFLNIPPSPRPIIADNTSGIELIPLDIENTRPNVNKPAAESTSGSTPNLENIDDHKVLLKEEGSTPSSSTVAKPSIETKDKEQIYSPAPSKTPEVKQTTPNKISTAIFGTGSNSTSKPVEKPKSKPTLSPSSPAKTPSPVKVSPATPTKVSTPTIKSGGK